MQRKMLGLIGLIALVGGLLAVQSAAAQAGTARIRLIHAVADAPAVDVLVDGQRVLSNFGFATASETLDVAAGDHQVTIVPTGQDASAALVQTNATFAANTSSLAVVLGVDQPEVRLYADNLSPLASGKARVRVIHTSPDAPGVDVEVISGPTLVRDLSFGESSDYFEVDEGTYNLRAVTTGATNVIVQLPQVALEGNTIYDVIVVDRLANIQVVTATSTPDASVAAPRQTVAGAEGMMPETGIAEDRILWISLAMVPLALGLLLRCYNACITPAAVRSDQRD